MDAVSLHDYRNLKRVNSVESLLLREADMLDMLGVVGILREFAWGPNDLKVCYECILARRNRIAGQLTLPRAETTVEERLISVDQILAQLTLDSFKML